MLIRSILLGGVLPGAAAAAALFFAWRGAKPNTPDAERKASRLMAPIVFALALLPAELVVREGLPSLWPRGAPDRIPHAAFALMLAGLVEAIFARKPLPATLLRAAVVASAMWMLLWPRVPAFWKPLEAAAWIGGLSALVAMIGSAVDHTAERRRGMDVPLALTMSLTAQSIVLFKSGNAYLAQMAGGAAAGVGGAMAAAMLVPSLSIARGGVTVACGLKCCLGAAGHYYAPDGIPLVQTLLVLFAPLGCVISLIRPVARLGVLSRAAIVATVCAIPTAVAVVLAVRSVS